MTATNREILERLFQQKAINLGRGAIFDHVPPPLPANFDFAKVEGMKLGLAIGDRGRGGRRVAWPPGVAKPLDRSVAGPHDGRG